MNSRRKAIIILGGWLKKDKGCWRTTFFHESGATPPLGDRLRVLAGYYLFKTLARPAILPVIVVSGGKGHLKKVKGAPAVAAVLKSELITLGVPARSIIKEGRSSSTYQQLRALDGVCRKKRLRSVIIVSNRYHVPRVWAMIKYAPGASYLKSMFADRRLTVISAEEIVLKRGPASWKRVIDEAYRSKAMRDRILQERRGVAQIKNGTYQFH